MSGSFADFSQWSKAINDDAFQHHRFATRFLLVRGLDAWKNVISFLRTETQRQIKLSTLCSSEDTVPYLTMEKIRGLLSDCSGKRVLIYPISECLRFCGNGSQLLGQLAQLEGSPESRIYVPLFEFEDVFHAGVESLARYAAGELAPFWRINGNDQVRLQVSPLKFFESGTAILDGIKAYLEKWESGGASSIILRTQLIKSCEPAMGRLEVSVYHDAFNILTRKLESDLDESWGSDIQWKWLLEQIGAHSSVEKLAAARFNALDFDGSKVLMEWNKLDENTKWLAWLWGKTVRRDDKLILSIIHNSSDHVSLYEDLYNVVFQRELTDAELNERRELLKLLGVHVPPKSFLHELELINSPSRKLACLSGLTSQEKLIAVECVSSLLEEEVDPAGWITRLETVFPELSFYLRQIIHKDELLSSYFAHYTVSRTLNKVSDKLKEHTARAARNKHYYVYATRLSSLEKHIQTNEKIIWFDGLGLEWMGLISGIVSEYNDVKMDFLPVRANLPSVTDTNMTDDEGSKKYRGLDQMAHNYDYSFPEYFIREIEYVSSSFRAIIEGMEQGEQRIITSDHGLTPASFNTETIKGLSDVEPLHWGRDASYESARYGSDVDKDLFISDGDRLFLATHGRLFGGSAKRGQIHGGATLEEALVPIIRLKKTTDLKASLVIQPPQILDPKIKLDRHGSGVLRLRVYGAPKTVHVRIGLTTLQATLCDTGVWEVKLSGFNPGQIKAHVLQDQETVGAIMFEAIKGIKEIDLGL